MQLKPLIKIILPLLIIAVAIASFNYLKTTKAERKKPHTQEKVWQVATMDVQLESLAADLTLYATVESPSLHSASSPASAIVEHVSVKAGARVVKGDILIRLEQQDFKNSMDQANANLLDMQAQLLQLSLKHESDQKSLRLEQQLLKLSQEELNRVKSLKQKGLGSDSVLTDAKIALAKQQLSVLNKSNAVAQYKPKKQQLNAKLMGLNAALNQANLAINRSIIKANFDGIISRVDVSEGDRVKADQKLISLYPSLGLEAKTRIPARFQQEIQLMLSAQQKVEATASLANKNIRMQLARMAGMSAANGTEVYFTITQGQQLLRVGNFLKLNVQRAKQANIIKLPLQALYGTDRIYTIKNERLKGLNVATLGHYKDRNGKQHVLIRHPDLLHGDKIVTTHLPNAITGLKVKSSEK